MTESGSRDHSTHLRLVSVEDFSSTHALAAYLATVAADDALFASYFWWRDYYRVVVSSHRNDICLY